MKTLYPVSAAGVPLSATALQSKGDPVADMTKGMAAEQRARATHEWLINLADDPGVIAPLKFLREREVVHFQRFGEVLRIV
jgi:spore coat protein JC